MEERRQFRKPKPLWIVTPEEYHSYASLPELPLALRGSLCGWERGTTKACMGLRRLRPSHRVEKQCLHQNYNSLTIHFDQFLTPNIHGSSSMATEEGMNQGEGLSRRIHRLAVISFKWKLFETRDNSLEGGSLPQAWGLHTITWWVNGPGRMFRKCYA